MSQTDRFAALRGTPDPELPPEQTPNEDAAVIAAAEAIAHENNGRTLCLNQSILIHARSLANLCDAVYARAKARGER
jgi:hypothetical protein